MRIRNLFLLILFLFMGNHLISSQSKKEGLPVIDISKKYPEKKISLQNIAEMEHIPLETTDDVLLSGYAVLSHVSDNYILVHEPILGDIFVFDRNGKIYTHFNHKGQSGWEYIYIGGAGTILDEKNEEIYVCAYSIQVYSLKGEHKRTLKLNTLDNNSRIFNFDDETLLVYDDVIVDPGLDKNTKENPYYFISKKDGSITSVLDIHLPERYSTRMAKINADGSWSPILMYFPHNMNYGRDFVIADISSDTLYLLNQNKNLTPLLIRKPSVHASEPRTILTPLLTTDKFILLGLILLDFNSKGGRIPVLMYEFETGEISRVSIFLDAGYKMRWGPGRSPAIEKNRTAQLVQASSILDAYEKKQLKGDFERFIKTLDETDNPVVRIIRFK